MIDLKMIWGFHPLPALKKFSSIFMGFYNGNPFVVANNTQRIRLFKNKRSKAIIFASSFPAIFNEKIYIVRKKYAVRF